MRLEGFVAGTLVCAPTGYARIQDLSVGDDVIVYDSDSGNLVSEQIAHRASHEVERIMQLTVDGEIIEMSEDQLLLIVLVMSISCHNGSVSFGGRLKSTCY